MRVHYDFHGDVGAPVLILSNSLGTTLEMWDSQLSAFASQFRVLRYDTRGHGGSFDYCKTSLEYYEIADLGRDVLALADALNIDQFHFCGLSMGGLIGLWLAVNAPRRLRRLVLCNTAAKIGTAEGWNARIDMVRSEGMKAVAAGAVERWFTTAFASREHEQVEALRQQVLACNPSGYLANCGAIRDADFSRSLANIRIPILFIAGLHDPVTSVADGFAVTNAVAGSQLVELEAAHMSNIEACDAFNATLLSFFSAPGPINPNNNR